jgi:hypothetical protein
MQFLPLVVLLLGMPLVLVSALAFDAIVLIELDRYRESWVADGMPLPFYRRDERFSWSLRSWLATSRCSIVWLFVSPKWIREDVEASRYLRRMRISAAAWNLAAMPLFILSAIAAALWG